VECLRREKHDVLWINEFRPGESDENILDLSFSESRVLLTEDWDFGELVVRYGKQAHGVVIIALPAIGGRLEPTAKMVAEKLNEFGEGLVGYLTILEPGRVRRRRILPGVASDEGFTDNDG
jgi:predicted nuclease of predicted toxin-antitoxin system